MTKFGKWLKEHWKAGAGTMPDDLANLTAQLEGVAKGYEQWEADMVLDRTAWMTEDGLPHLTQHLQDKLMELQEQRTAALAACKEFQEKYSHD